jgi:polysaccharide deacetylase family protein (PEP-CTERM system associated)
LQNPTAVLGTCSPGLQAESEPASKVILSFDVEEHDRIEAAAGLAIDSAQKAHYRARLEPSTLWVLDRLAESRIRATFFIVGEIALHNPELIRRIARAGHEVASHSFGHCRVHRLDPASFREDVMRSKAALEDLTGAPVVGYRAPTFSVTRETAWAVDVLAELGMLYDSSIYPVRHDRYGVPAAPRAPFLVRGERHSLLELPPTTLRLLSMNLPMGGGGYFRLFPLFMTRWAVRQTARDCRPAVANLYFHPWEFDPDQERLPLGRLSRFRTYVGIRRSRAKLASLLTSFSFSRAADVAQELQPSRANLPTFALSVVTHNGERGVGGAPK